jgi:Fe-S-cluster-containing dehydrogenase component
MATNRRALLKGMAAAGAVVASGVTTAEARARKRAPADAIGMLYDATLCIGCKTCVVACKKANGLPPDTSRGELWDAADDLNSKTKNIIKLYRGEGRESYMKAQCMHCVDPSCVNACMMGSLEKREFGVVTWLSERCTGCRYCGVACPYGIPKYEYDKAFPDVIKCEMCAQRPDKPFSPACCEVCPRAAVISGKYADLLVEAKRRLAEHPERYEPKVFGETDGGGTQVLYLSAKGIPFGKLGLPDLGPDPVPELQQTIQHGIYQGFIAPAALFAVLAGVIWRNRKVAAKGEGVES